MNIGIARAANLCASIICSKRTRSSRANIQTRKRGENRNKKLVMKEVKTAGNSKRRKRHTGMDTRVMCYKSHLIMTLYAMRFGRGCTVPPLEINETCGLTLDNCEETILEMKYTRLKLEEDALNNRAISPRQGKISLSLHDLSQK
jgi:hypothetical protein